MGLMQTWGLGAELTFGAGNANMELGRTRRAVMALKGSFTEIQGVAGNVAGELGKVALALTPITLGFGYLVDRASTLAQQLEGQKLTMEVLLGSATKAGALIAKLRQNAAVTPFGQADVIEGSKALLRITGQNVDRNLELVKTVETLAALNPGRSVQETAQALLMGTTGTFDSLRTMGIVIDGQAMAKNGTAGGKAYTDAVLKAITEQLAQKTGGLDLVGRLGATFSGRMSTLKDTIDNVLESAGEKINAKIGPAIDFLTQKINDSTANVVTAIDMISDRFDDFRQKHLDPIVKTILGLWDGLGTGGQVAVFAALITFAAIATGATALGGVLGAVGLAISGIIGAITALAPLLAPEVFGPIALAILAVAAAAVFLGGVFYSAVAQPGEGIVHLLERLGKSAVDFATYLSELLLPSVLALAGGFLTGLGSTPGQAFDEMGAAVRGAYLWVSQLFEYLLPALGNSSGLFYDIGLVLGGLISGGLSVMADLVVFVVKGFEAMYAVFQPLIASVYQFVGGFLDLITGATTADAAINRMLNGVVGGFLAMILAVVSLFLTGLGQILRAVSILVSSIPGAAALVGWTGNLGADGILTVQRDLSDNLTNAILGSSVQKTNADREQKAADKANAVVDNTVHVNVDAPVSIDGNEIARANGDAAVGAGERGLGPKLPTEQRGRVLRRGLEVTPLSPTEVL